MDPRPGVQALVAPLSAATFCEEYWPLRYFGSHGPPERLAGLCDLAELRDIESLLQVHRGRTRVVFTNSGGRYRETEVSPQQALRLYEAGMTVCLSEVELASASIAAWLLALARDLALPARAVQCNAYASPQDKGFAKHCDDHEVFVVQIRGEKLWSIATNNDVLYPTQNYIPGIGRPEEIRLYCPQDAPSEMPSDALTVHMLPGSTLFLPRGIWHATGASGQSLSLSFSFSAPSGLDLVLKALRHRLVREPAWRAPLQTGYGSGVRARAAAALGELMGDLATMIEDTARDDFIAAALPEIPLLLKRRRGAKMAVEESGGDEHLSRAHLDVPENDPCVVEVERESVPLLRWISIVKEPFTAEQVILNHPRLAPTLVRAALQALLETGFLECLVDRAEPV